MAVSPTKETLTNRNTFSPRNINSTDCDTENGGQNTGADDEDDDDDEDNGDLEMSDS